MQRMRLAFTRLTRDSLRRGAPPREEVKRLCNGAVPDALPKDCNSWCAAAHTASHRDHAPDASHAADATSWDAAGITCCGCCLSAMTWQSGAFPLFPLCAAAWPCCVRFKPRSRTCALLLCSFRWRIADWAAVSAGEADRCRSTAFYAGGLPWRLLLFPRGNPTPPRRLPVTDHLSLYVEYAGGEHAEPAALDDARIALTVLRCGVPPAPKASRPHFTQRARPCTARADKHTRGLWLTCTVLAHFSQSKAIAGDLHSCLWRSWRTPRAAGSPRTVR